MTNQEIAKMLRHVAVAYTIKDEKKFRFQIIAYTRAADALENSPTQVKDLFQEGKLEAVPGIGPSLKAHIEELLTTGNVKHFDWVMQDIPKAMFPLLDVPGFGPKKAYKLVVHFGLKNPETVIPEIEALATSGVIAPLEGFGEKSQEDILEGIKSFKQGDMKVNRMVLPFAAELAEKIITYLQTSKDILAVYPLGSLRRMRSTIGDIDLAVSTNDPASAIAHFVAYPYKERIIEQGEAGASLVLSGGKQVDLLTQPPEAFGSLLQHFTGSKNHNVKLREHALKQGLSLSEKGIKHKDTGKMDYYDTEEKFYKALGMDWVPPEIREDTGEVELALKGNLPELVTLEDIKGDFHIHSAFPIEPSHDMGKHSMETMVKKALSLHYRYMAFTEHNPSVSKHTPEQTYALIQKKRELIDKLNKQYPNIHLYNSLELDILADGTLAIDEESMKLLDFVIVSIHSVLSMDTKTMTARVLKGLAHPKAKVLTHPSGRILNERPGYELDWEQLFAFCKTHNKAIEINAWPTRLDLSDMLVREAVNKGVKLVINTDSHAVDHMNLMKYGIAVARRGWAQKRDILNTMEYNDLEMWLGS